MKNLGLTVIVLIVLGVTSQHCQGQQQPRTTVQLPVFQFFGVGTTINVPDRGQALLGGIKRSAEGSVERGVPILGNLPVIGRPFKNRAVGRSQSNSNISATVQIYDLREMDRALLEEARRDRVLKIGGPAVQKKHAEKTAIQKKADFITRNLGRNKKR